jgi:hypothetical protein
MLFVQIAEGIDDRTWMHHLKQGDYSAWFREIIKDRELAAGYRYNKRPALSTNQWSSAFCQRPLGRSAGTQRRSERYANWGPWNRCSAEAAECR